MNKKRQAKLGLNLQVHRLAFIVDDLTNAILQEQSIDLTNAQYLILKAVFILKQPSQTDIAEYIGSSKPAVSRHCKALEAKNYIRIKEKDRRMHHIAFTKTGKEVFKASMELLQSELQKHFGRYEQLGRLIAKELHE